MARGGLPLPPAGLQARPRRLGSAPAPRPSALPRMSCGPAQPDLTSLGAPSGPASCQNKGDLAMEALLEGIQNRGRDGGFLTSCEAELQELMKQIDIMVAHKKSEWEGQTHALETCLDIREQELKALRSQLDMKHKEAQLANRKQKLESVELSSQSEIQHLSSKLERANDTICANELEIERLTMRVNDLVGTNMAVMQEQRQKEERLRESEKLLEVLQEEKRELKAALQTQENFIHEARIQKEKLQAKLKATDSQHTVETIRSLEESQAERRYASQGQGDLENVLSRLDFTHASEELLQAEVTRLEGSLESVSATCKQLSQELMEKYEELKKMEVHNNEYRAEIKKLKEQILQAEQSYSSVLEGMKMEISQLTRELHQRDITIASTKSSSSDMEKRLKAEIQKAEEKDVEHKEILGQLESLKLENRHLSEMVMKLELGLHEAKEISLADLQENYIEALNKLVSENQQLQKDLMDTRTQLEISTQMCKKNCDRIFKPTHSRVPEFKNMEFKPAHGQHRHDGIKTEHYKAGLHSPRGRASDSVGPTATGLSSPSHEISPCCSTISLPSNFLCKTHSVPSVLDTNETNFSDSVSESINDQEDFVSSCPLALSPLGSIATRFLEEEELRSHHILERLDAHIEELKRESEKTVKQFTALK
ncbi:centrosomal protein of 63 kDa isoform X1 [Camelus ferus]|uniref:Centrosomal protein of 63 kDa n=4 Tax=Camelus TaxID=9836 RepID=A0A8B8TP19_CAMFR|nr:centrosomal protein of 63 kDa isoform X5 [Camelus dromedarius]XP_032344001.1 centrosomal protein of 63 kDa isoform X1 [Camelus ferus]